MTYRVIFVVFCEWIHWAVWLQLKGRCVSAFFPSIHGTGHPLALLTLLKKYSQHKRDCTLLCNQHMYWEQRREFSFKVRPSFLFINDSSWVCCSFVYKDIFFCRNKPSSTVSSWITTSPSHPPPSSIHPQPWHSDRSHWNLWRQDWMLFNQNAAISG